MPVASPAKIVGPLTDRLNALRVLRGSRVGLELDQIKFQARGLRNSDRAAFLAVSGMIAALENDAEALLAHSDELEECFPERVACQINVLRSLMALRLTAKAEELAMRIVDRLADVHDANVVAHCLMLIGSLESARSTAARFIDVYGNMDLQSVHELRTTLAMTEVLSAAGFNGEDLHEFFEVARDSLLRQGWATPTLDFNTPRFEDPDGPLAICRFVVAVDEPEELLTVEETVMDDLIATNDRLFCNAAIVLSVVPHVEAA